MSTPWVESLLDSQAIICSGSIVHEDDENDEMAMVEGVDDAIVPNPQAPARRVADQRRGPETVRIRLQLGELGEDAHGHLLGDGSQLVSRF